MWCEGIVYFVKRRLLECLRFRGFGGVEAVKSEERVGRGILPDVKYFRYVSSLGLAVIYHRLFCRYDIAR